MRDRYQNLTRIHRNAMIGHLVLAKKKYIPKLLRQQEFGGVECRSKA
jgi:hypothetical protein